LPVCARCVGIYAGAALTAVVAVLIRAGVDRKSERRHPPLSAAHSRLVLAAAAAPALLTLLYEWTTGVTPSNEVRALTGLFLGAAVAWLLVRLE
jgi:uncharacterized membrane protein